MSDLQPPAPGPVENPASPKTLFGRWLIVAGLVFLNIVLAVGVYQRLGERSASAQGIGNARPDLVSVAGSAGGQTAIYMLDATSGKLVALKLDVQNRQLQTAASANVADVLRRIP